MPVRNCSGLIIISTDTVELGFSRSSQSRAAQVRVVNSCSSACFGKDNIQNLYHFFIWNRFVGIMNDKFDVLSMFTNK